MTSRKLAAMRQLLATIRNTLLDSPACRTFFNAILPIAAGVLSGAFTFEITYGSTIRWAVFYKTKSFYWLLALSVLIYIYNRAVYKRDTEVDRFLDVDYCKAYMRSQCLPEAAERYRDLIRRGKIGELQRAMTEVDNILK
jgi:hypothetical protein